MPFSCGSEEVGIKGEGPPFQGVIIAQNLLTEDALVYSSTSDFIIPDAEFEALNKLDRHQRYSYPFRWGVDAFGELGAEEAERRAEEHAAKLREKARIFCIHTDNGIKTMLAPEYANELHVHHALSFGTSMRRLAHEDIKWSDGTLFPKGSSIVVSSHKMWDSVVYPNPETSGSYQSLGLRESLGHETSAQLVLPSPEHFGFGYGKHACPGRFFAANEIKIALCHILLKYDFKLADGCKPTVRKSGISLNSDPSAKLVIRWRQEEIAL
ncbi:hypothetical protein CDV55_104642 [Aspergillus turcosus]|uniref:Uncharacterized protein n=1 Tax=Aspergillus turcosus TaxID=1245748 RepID=A0A397IDN1_9EURO|nr:hypothetical protein CDV55_104642 [Aspergillus turcosus]RLM00962.1 hypothetical protein CFD26_105029 [Aspergillus turcosus]